MDENAELPRLSIKKGVFMDKTNKLPLSSMKRAVFMAGGSGYLLYLHDLDLSTPCGRSR